MKNSARRTVGGAKFSLDKATAPAGAEKEAVEAAREEGDTGTIEETNQAQAECEFDELKLDEAHEKAIENLREEEEVVVLMPAKEFVIPHGPKRTVLYWLCGDAERTEKINDSLEGEPQRTGLPLTPTCLVSHHYSHHIRTARCQGATCIPHRRRYPINIGDVGGSTL